MKKVKKIKLYQLFPFVAVVFIFWATHISSSYGIHPQEVSRVERFLRLNVLFQVASFFYAAYVIPALLLLKVQGKARQVIKLVLLLLIIGIVCVTLYAFWYDFTLILMYKWLAFAVYIVAGILLGLLFANLEK
jgi:hypothetical protein